MSQSRICALAGQNWPRRVLLWWLRQWQKTLTSALPALGSWQQRLMKQ
jgi:hypothetical protein